MALSSKKARGRQKSSSLPAVRKRNREPLSGSLFRFHRVRIVQAAAQRPAARFSHDRVGLRFRHDIHVADAGEDVAVLRF
ncbi:MAG: hypothetical protein ABI593_06900, partial [Betaproteobacteria bacterium]